MTLFAIAFGSSVIGMLIVKLFCDRDAQRSLQREKRQTQLTLESHVLVVEERNGQIEILTNCGFQKYRLTQHVL